MVIAVAAVAAVVFFSSGIYSRGCRCWWCCQWCGVVALVVASKLLLAPRPLARPPREAQKYLDSPVNYSLGVTTEIRFLWPGSVSRPPAPFFTLSPTRPLKNQQVLPLQIFTKINTRDKLKSVGAPSSGRRRHRPLRLSLLCPLRRFCSPVPPSADMPLPLFLSPKIPPPVFCRQRWRCR